MSEIKIVKIECPYCGADLKVAEGQNFVVCGHCDKQVAIDDGIQRSYVKQDIHTETVIHHVDDTRLSQLQYEQERLRQVRQQAATPYVIWTVAAFTVIILLLLFKWEWTTSFAALIFPIIIPLLFAAFFPKKGFGRKVIITITFFVIIVGILIGALI